GTKRRTALRHPRVRRRRRPARDRPRPVRDRTPAGPAEGWPAMIRIGSSSSSVTRLAAALVVLAVVGAITLPGTPAAPSTTHGPIEGSGSSWSANAVNQWIADVDSQGLQVVFTASGSAQGRKDYSFRNVDFAVSDIPFQGRDPITGDTDDSNGRPYV